MRSSIFICLCAITRLLWGQDCISDWSYVREIQIVNPSSEAIVDAQLPFPFDTQSLVDSSKLRADAADLRIFDGNCDPLPFFLDSAAEAIQNQVWVRVASLAPSDTLTLRLYYGNDTASSVADGQAVFDFFDDFSSGAVDENRWEPIGGYAILGVVDGVLEYASNGMNPGPRFKFLRTKQSFREKAIFEFKAEVSNSNGFGFSSADTVLERIIFRQSGFGFDTLNQVAWNEDTTDNGRSISQSYPLIRFPRREARDGRLMAEILDQQLTLTRFENINDSSLNVDTFQVDRTQMTGFHFIVSSFINATIYLDYLRVRKPIPEGLEVILGEEVLLEETTSIDLPELSFSLTLYPNPAFKRVDIAGLPTGLHHVEVYNLLGERVAEQSTWVSGQETMILDIASLESGLFIVSVESPLSQVRHGLLKVKNE